MDIKEDKKPQLPKKTGDVLLCHRFAGTGSH